MLVKLVRIVFLLAVIVCGKADAAQVVQYSLGDSEALGFGSTNPPVTGFVPQVAAAKGYAVSNLAVSGDEAGDQAGPIYGLTPGPNSISTYLIAENNQRHWNLNPTNLASYHATLMAELAWLAINNADIIRGTSAAWTYAGTWSNTAAYGLGKNTNTNGDTATVTLTGTVIYVALIQQDGCGGVYDILIDGADEGTYDCAPASAITTFNGKTYMPKMYRFDGLAPGTHTLVIVSVAPTSPANKTYVDWAWGNAMRTPGPYPKVYLGTPLPNTAAGYIANGGSLAATEAYRAIDFFVQKQMRDDGVAVGIADGFPLINTSINISADGTHPNDSGYVVEAGAFVTPMN